MAPSNTQTIELLRTMWAEVLKVDEVSQTDTFLELGGDSLSANEILVRISDTFGVDLDLGTLLDCGTAEALAERLAAESRI